MSFFSPLLLLRNNPSQYTSNTKLYNLSQSQSLKMLDYSYSWLCQYVPLLLNLYCIIHKSQIPLSFSNNQLGDNSPSLSQTASRSTSLQLSPLQQPSLSYLSPSF